MLPRERCVPPKLRDASLPSLDWEFLRVTLWTRLLRLFLLPAPPVALDMSWPSCSRATVTTSCWWLAAGTNLNHVAAELQAQFGATVKTVALDLGAAPAPKFLFDQLQREGIAVEVLVNNAGFGAFGDFASMAEEEILGQIQLNITALTHLTRLFLPPMLPRGRGKLMNVAYTAAFQPGPLMA